MEDEGGRMTEQKKTENQFDFTSQPPITAMMQHQGEGVTGNKYTNVFMPNQQQAVMEYVSEPYIPEEVERRYPLEAMLIRKRALGIETEIESYGNDKEYTFILLLHRMGYHELAEKEALSHMYHREGQRTHMGFERDHQVMQKTMSQDVLTTINQNNRPGFWSKIGRFASGEPKPPQQQ